MCVYIVICIKQVNLKKKKVKIQIISCVIVFHNYTLFNKFLLDDIYIYINLLFKYVASLESIRSILPKYYVWFNVFFLFFSKKMSSYSKKWIQENYLIFSYLVLTLKMKWKIFYEKYFMVFNKENPYYNGKILKIIILYKIIKWYNIIKKI